MKTENKALEPIRVNTRLRQGDALSPVLEKVVRESNITACILLAQSPQTTVEDST